MAEEKPIIRHQLLVGKHQGFDFSKDPDPVTGRRPSKKYVQGDIVEDVVDLEEKLGKGKFRRLDGGSKSAKVAPRRKKDTFDAMTEDELRQAAADNEVNIDDVDNLDEIRDRLRGYKG